MNANELPAEQLAQWCDEASEEYGNKPLVQVATMLRQQQAEIKLLRKRFGEELDAHHSALRKIKKLRKVQTNEGNDDANHREQSSSIQD
jgi:hypothetical protein